MAMERIDANCILGRWTSGGPTYRDAGELLVAMDELGIDGALVRHSLGAGYDLAWANVLLAEQIAGSHRLIPCWASIPRTMGERDAGEPAAVPVGARAVCVYPATHGYPAEPWALAPLLGPLAEQHALLLIEAAECDWASLDRLAAAFAGLRLLLLSPGYRALRPLYILLDRHPNLHVDLSNLATFRGIEALAARAGPERLLFGTGQPRNDGAGIVAALNYMDLDEAGRAAILGSNLRRLLAEVAA